MLGRVFVVANKSPFPPGYALKFGEHPTLKGSGTVNYDSSKIIPLIITTETELANNWGNNSQTHLYKTVYGINVQYLFCQPMTSYSAGVVRITNYKGISVGLIRLNNGLDSLLKRSSIVTNFSFTCTMWLEKVGS